MAEPTQLYTLAEAAQLTGLSVEALRLRIKRGRLEGIRGNDGLRVRLTTADLEEMRPRPSVQQKPTLVPTDSHVGPTETNMVKVLETAVEALRQRAERAEAGQSEARLRADQLATELSQLRDQAAADVADTRERAARAEGMREVEQAARERAEVRAAHVEAELAAWTAGGPIARALRAFLNRR